MPLSLSIEYRDISRATTGLRAAAATFVSSAVLTDAGTIILVRNIAAEVPVKTGKGKASIVGKTPGVWGISYLQFVEDGTKAHTIVPVKAKALRFVVNGTVVFAKRVNHPGTKPNKFIERGIKNAEPALRVLLLENGRRITSMVQSGG